MMTSRTRSFLVYFFALMPWIMASTAYSQYTVPMRFDVFSDGAVELPPLEFSYDLATSQGQKLQMGTLSFDPANLRAHLVQTTKQVMFTFQWPENLMYEGQLEMISRTGQVLWQAPITRQDMEQWTERKKKLNSKNAKPAQFGMFFPSLAESPFKDLNQTVRFCYSFNEGEGHTRMCTTYYELETKKKIFRWLGAAMGERPARAILNGKTVDELMNTVVVEENQVLSFFAETNSGASFEFVAKAKKPKFIEMTVLKDGEKALVTGEGPVPRETFKRVGEKQDSNFVKLIGFQQTIGDKREYWQASITLQDPMIMISGEGGGVFKQKFIIKRLPDESLRPYLDKGTPEGTYVDGPTLLGKKKAGSSISSKQNKVSDKAGGQNFSWDFGAKKRGEYNRSYVTVADGKNDQSFRAYHELYKGYPRELSFRLSTNVGSGSVSLMGEFAFNYWFEDIFGWTNYYLSRQRWGTSIKAFQSLGSVEISSLKETLANQTVDLKYRFTPGLWGRDESWGAMFSYLQTKYGEFDTNMAGGGIFWARSMPKVFDDIFNWFSFLRYPKWVDFELIYYMQSLKNDYKVTGTTNNRGNWALNFHGKVLWTEAFFGEAGFGVKQFDYNKEIGTSVRRKNFDFTTFYGTFGIGYNF